MDSIKIIRLNYGDDIIGNIENLGDALVVEYPMSIRLDVKKETNIPYLIMKPWLPIDLIKDEHVTFGLSDILSIFEPKEEIKEFYMTTQEKVYKQSQTTLLKEQSNSLSSMNNANNILLELVMAKIENKIH